MKILLTTGLVIITVILSASVERWEAYIEFEVDSRKEIDQISRIISVDDVRGRNVTANVNRRELEKFEKLGYSYRFITPEMPIEIKMAETLEQFREWDFYPAYEVYVEAMYQFAADYPDICQIENIGMSVEGRELLFVKISDNVASEENEPEFMYSAQMHGDELVTFILMLNLIEHLLSNYGIQPDITNLVDNIEIWINPLANPDGTYAGGNHTVYGAQRRNANNVDLNRNFPDMLDGDHPDGNDWQPETIAMMEFADAHNFVLSSNLHSGAEVVNYPWDRIQQRHADDDWWQDVSRTYADAVHEVAPPGYLDGFNNGITNGWDWYSINGGRQDYMNYFKNCREMTLELSDIKILPVSELMNHWTYNREALLLYISQALYGIRGVITDAGGNPLRAKVEIPEHDNYNSHVFSDPVLGNYHRMIYPGSYDLKISCYGYYPQIFEDVQVNEHDVTILDISLEDAPQFAVSGLVTSQSSGEPVAGASLDILNTPLETAVTDSSGFYQFAMVAAGSYDIRISAVHHLPCLDEIEISEGNTEFNFELVQGYTEDFELAEIPPIYISGGNQPWSSDSEFSFEGQFSARSGNIGHGQTSSIYLTMNFLEDSYISFYKKVSCEDDDNDNYDYLKFSIDSIEQERWDGESDWSEEIFDLSSGQHILEWQYRKDGSVSNGEDAAWIDYITFPPAAEILRDLDADPDSLYGEISEGEDLSGTFQLLNDGLAATHYTISVNETWLNYGPVSGMLAGGAQQIFVLEFQEIQLDPGEYEADIVIDHFDFNSSGQILLPWHITVTGSDSQEDQITAVTGLRDNYPNPFNPETVISYQISAEDKVTVTIYNIRGQLIRTLVDELQSMGEYSVIWDGRDNDLKPLPSGVYFYRLTSGSHDSFKKMIMIK